MYYIADPLSNYPVVLGVDDGDTDGDNKSEFGYLEVDGQAGAANIRGDLAPQGVAGEHDLHVSFNVAVGANTANPTSPVGGFYCVDTGDGEVIFGPIGSVPPLPVPVPPVGVPDLPLPV